MIQLSYTPLSAEAAAFLSGDHASAGSRQEKCTASHHALTVETNTDCNQNTQGKCISPAKLLMFRPELLLQCAVKAGPRRAGTARCRTYRRSKQQQQQQHTAATLRLTTGLPQ
jgi:hypothetical protein